MKHRVIMLVVAMLVLSACAQPGMVSTTDNHTSAVQPSSATSVSSMNSQRDIVLAVANPVEPPSTHAGSTLLGYTPPGFYGAGQRAVSDLASLKQSYGLREVSGWPIKALNLYCVVLEAPPGVSRDDLLKMLAKDSRVKLAQPLQDYAVYADAAPPAAPQYNDPYVNLQRGFVETNAALAQTVSQGNGVHIAVIDTGVDASHPDLQGRIHHVQNLVDDNATSFNHDSHGTEVAGVIAADADNHQGIVGIAPKAILSVYKACWYDAPSAGARCNTFTLAKALAAIIDTNARIVNLSLGGPADPLLDKLLDQLLDQGRIVVTALPPSGSLAGFPDSAPGVLVVRVSGTSQAPAGILSAPGTDILTTQPGGGYDFTSGSSMSAAHVSGIVALMLSLNPQLDAQQVHDVLLRTSKVSNGMLQVNAASAVASLHDMRNADH
jgi:subtilisin family serine protease